MNHSQAILPFLISIPDEYVQIVTDFGGKVEALRLSSRTTGTLRDVLLTDNGNETAITENKFWKGMLLIPWANRIAYVGLECTCPIMHLCCSYVMHISEEHIYRSGSHKKDSYHI